MGAMVKSKLDYVLRKLFYDPKSTVAFTGISRLYHAAKSVLKGVRYKDIQNWLRYGVNPPITYTNRFVAVSKDEKLS